MRADLLEIADLIKSGRADLARVWLEMLANHGAKPTAAERQLAAQKRGAIERWAAKQPRGRVS